MFGKFVVKIFEGRKRFQHFFESLGNISNSIRYIGHSTSDLQDKYEEETFFIDKIFKDSNSLEPVIFDVGANVGDFSYSILMEASKNRMDFKLFSFEPAKKTFKILNSRFKGLPNVFCVNLGLSDEKKDVFLYSDREGSDLASVYNLENAYRKFDDRFKEVINLTTIDDFVIENRIGKIDYLKIDAEGHDFYVLKGAYNSIRHNKIRMIQFEFGPPNIESRIFFRDFWNLLSS